MSLTYRGIFAGLWACLFLAIAPHVVMAAVLWDRVYTAQGGGGIHQVNTFHVGFGTGANSSLTDSLFTNVPLTQGSVGLTFTATALNDPKFQTVVQSLTDGVDQWFVLGSDDTGITGGHQSGTFGSLAGGNGIDLHGFQIDAFTMTLLSRQVLIPGSDPNHNGQWQDTIEVYHLTIQGVPEPSSFALAAFGLIGLLVWQRRTCA
jgi:PEP-CTERM motif